VGTCACCDRGHPPTSCCCGLLATRSPSLTEVGYDILVCGHYSSNEHVGLCELSVIVESGVDVVTHAPYSFRVEWLLRKRRVRRPASVALRFACPGIISHALYGLFGRQSFGVATAAILPDTAILSTLGMPVLTAKLLNTTNPNTVLKDYSVPLCVGDGECVRSPFCLTSVVGVGHSCCAPCAFILTYKGVLQTSSNATKLLQSIQHDAATNKGLPSLSLFSSVANNILPRVALIGKARSLLADNNKQAARADRARLTLSVVQKETIAATQQLSGQLHKANSISDLVKFLGTLENTKELPSVAPGIIKCIADSLLRGRRHRQVSEEIKLFFARVLLHGGPQIHDQVSAAVLGPHVSTTRRLIRTLKKGKIYEWSPDRFEEVDTILTGLSLKHAPCMLVEDGTALEKHFDVVRRTNKVVLIGAASQSSYEFKTTTDFDAFLERAIVVTPLPATIFHLYLLVPLVHGAPAIPVVVQLMDGTTDTYNAASVARAWRYVWHHLLSRGVNMVGHSGDGAPPFRSATLQHLLRETGTTHGDRCISIQHFLIQMVLPYMSFSREQIPRPLAIASDFLHILFRLRRQFLDPARILVLFRLVCSPIKLITYENVKGRVHSLGLRAGDMDFHDKQNFNACLRLFDICTRMTKGVQETYAVDTIRSAMKCTPEYFGLYLFLEFCHCFTSIFVIKNISIKDIITNCTFCLTFLGYWDMSVHENPQCTRRVNFITKETRDDILMLMNVVILTIKMFSIHYPNVKFVPSMMSSRFNEYAFQGLRLGANNNNNRISPLDGLNRIEIVQGMILAEHGKVHLQGLKSKRGMPKSTERIDHQWDKQPVGYYPSEGTMREYMDTGVAQVLALLKTELAGPGSGGERYVPWESIARSPLHIKETEGQLHQYMAKKHLLNQKPRGTSDWDKYFDVMEEPANPNTRGDAIVIEQRNVHVPDVSADVPEPPDDYAHDEDEEHLTSACTSETLMRMARTPTADELNEQQGVLDLDLVVDGDKRGNAPTPPTEMTLADVCKGRSSREAVSQFRVMVTSVAPVTDKQDEATDLVASQIAQVLVAVYEAPTTAQPGLKKKPSTDPVKLELDKVEVRLRSLAKELNSLHRKRNNLRVLDRFGQYKLADPTKFSKELDDKGGFEDEDYIAVWYVQPGVSISNVESDIESRLTDYVSFAMIERCVRRDTSKSGVKDVAALTPNEKEGELVLRWFEPVVTKKRHSRCNVTQTSPGGLKFHLPLNTQWGYSQRVKCDAVIQRVNMTLPDKLSSAGHVLTSKDGGEPIKADYYTLPTSDERAIVSEVISQIKDGRILLTSPRDVTPGKTRKRVQKKKDDRSQPTSPLDLTPENKRKRAQKKRDGRSQPTSPLDLTPDNKRKRAQKKRDGRNQPTSPLEATPEKKRKRVERKKEAKK
jgi:hypothetical protein